MPTKERLRDIINDHFNYEVIELANCKHFYKFGVPSNLSQMFANIGLEHTLLHSRLLYEFYFNLEPNQNPYGYPRANMYIPDFKKPAFTANITDKFWKKVNNQILHLGIDRTGESSEKFNVGDTIRIANDLFVITKDFLTRLETIDNGFYLGERLRELKSNMDMFISI